MNTIRTTITTFRESYLSSDTVDPENFSDWDSRNFRYKFFWAMFENTAYEEAVHTWAKGYKTRQALYKYIRGIYNPSARVCNFQRDHVWAGRLNIVDGMATDEGALPIVTDNDALRGAIGALWKASNWQAKKDLVVLWGAVFGDVAISIVDNPEKNKVYLRIVNPGTLTRVERDFFGNVKSYEIQEIRVNDEDEEYEYREIATRDGDNVLYTTYLDGEIYDFGQGGEWTVPYGFIPMVIIPHIDVGLDWGYSELHTGRGKFAEIDDIASKLNDQVRKTVDAKWLASGVENPKLRQKSLTMTGATPTENKPQPGREEEHILYAPQGASMQPLIAPLPIDATNATIQQMYEALENEYPELKLEKLTVQGALSGAALRIARQPVETKILQRRAGYDDALVRVQQMAIAIGGWRGYDGYAGFNLASYEQGTLDHSIGERPVFRTFETDKVEEAAQFWAAAKIAGEAGVGLEAFLREMGWTEDKVEEILESAEYKSRLQSMQTGLLIDREEA